MASSYVTPDETDVVFLYNADLYSNTNYYDPRILFQTRRSHKQNQVL